MIFQSTNMTYVVVVYSVSVSVETVLVIVTVPFVAGAVTVLVDVVG